MKIVHLTHRAWPVAGGSERYVQELAQRQVKDGHDVTVVASDASSLSALWSNRGERISAKVPIEHAGVYILRLSPRYLPWGNVTFPLLRRFSWLAAKISPRLALRFSKFVPWFPQLSACLLVQQPDLLFAWNITLEGLSAVTAQTATQLGCPWISIPLLHLARPRFYTMSHQKYLIAQADQVWVLTEYERDYLLSQGILNERLHVLSPGIDPKITDLASGERFRKRHDIMGPMVVTLGALGYDKGTLHLIRAAERLWEEGKSFKLLLAGTISPSVQRELRHMSARQREHCRYLGWLSEAEKNDLLAASQIMALPSRTESFGMVFLEAWAHGKPVIGARSGALECVIDHGCDGYLVEFGNVAELAAIIERLLSDKTYAAHLGACGQEKVYESYSWEVQYGKMKSAVHELRLMGES